MDNKSKKVIKTIVYATKNYFYQKVAVDENLTDDEVLKLWKNDEMRKHLCLTVIILSLTEM